MRRNHREGVISCNPGDNSPPRLKCQKYHRGVVFSGGCALLCGCGSYVVVVVVAVLKLA